MGSYRQLLGMAAPAKDRKDRVTPVEEHYEGTNFPYRGTEPHGVEPTPGVEYGDVQNEYTTDAATKIAYLPEPKEDDPVAVKIVQGAKRERLDWRALRFFVTDVPQEIVGRHEKRRSLQIYVHEKKNDGTDNTDPIFVGPDSGLRPYTGFRIPAGSTMDTLHTTENVYAVCESGKTVEISIVYEYGVEL